MAGIIKKRYTGGYARAFLALRERFSRPLSLLLLGLFFLTHAVAVYTELKTHRWSAQSAATAELSPDTPCDLQAEASGSREVRGGRQCPSSLLAGALEAWRQHRQVVIEFEQPISRFHVPNAPPYVADTSASEDPFSSRPPPSTPALQG